MSTRAELMKRVYVEQDGRCCRCRTRLITKLDWIGVGEQVAGGEVGRYIVCGDCASAQERAWADSEIPVAFGPPSLAPTDWN